MLNARVQKLLDVLPEDFEAAIIGTGVNRFYLLDFEAGEAGTLLVLPGRLVYIIDSRYIEAAREQVKDAEVVLEEDALVQAAQYLSDAGVKKLYLEDGITLGALDLLKQKIPNVEFNTSSTLSNALMELRQVKDDEELARMRKAQSITDAGFAHILPFIQEGVSEVELALELEYFMRRNGAEKIAFTTICVAGPTTSQPHGMPGDYRVKPGDFITMDFGAQYKGYASDMTRTVAFGEPGEEKRRLYDTVLKAHLAGIEAAAAGKACAAVDKVARELIDNAGYAGKFGHGLGHAVGIEIHEEPRFSPKSKATLKSGMVMTVEPGIYLAGRFGCRIEDMVLIGQNGCEPLPKSPKQLTVL